MQSRVGRLINRLKFDSRTWLGERFEDESRLEEFAEECLQSHALKMDGAGPECHVNPGLVVIRTAEVPSIGGRMAGRHDEPSAGAQHPVHLAKELSSVCDVVDHEWADDTVE